MSVDDELMQAEEDLSDCPYFQYSRNNGPYGTCNRGCWEEPACIVDEPIDDWPSVRAAAAK